MYVKCIIILNYACLLVTVSFKRYGVEPPGFDRTGKEIEQENTLRPFSFTFSFFKVFWKKEYRKLVDDAVVKSIRFLTSTCSFELQNSLFSLLSVSPLPIPMLLQFLLSPMKVYSPAIDFKIQTEHMYLKYSITQFC